MKGKERVERRLWTGEGEPTGGLVTEDLEDHICKDKREGKIDQVVFSEIHHHVMMVGSQGEQQLYIAGFSKLKGTACLWDTNM